MKREKRLLSGLLAVVMVLSLMMQDITVIAAETVTTTDDGLTADGADSNIDHIGQGNADNQAEGTDGSDNSDETNDSDNTVNSDKSDDTDSNNGTNDSDDTDNADGSGDLDNTDNADGNDDSNNADSTDETGDTDETGNTDESDGTDETNDSDITNDPNEADQSDDANMTHDDEQTDDTNEDSISAIAPAEGPDWSKSQYIIFFDNSDGVTYKISKTQTYKTIDYLAPTTLYVVNTSDIEEIKFEASVALGYKFEIPEDLEDIISQENERKLLDRRWTYNYTIDISELSTTIDEPLEISLIKVDDEVSVKVSGDVVVDGIDEDGMAQVGGVVTIEVLNAGEVLAMITQDDKGNTVYTAMELDYENRYEFTVEKETAFVAANPDEVTYTIANSSTNKAKLTGEKGLKLNSLASSAQGYSEIVLNFTAVPNGSDGTDTESAYYEVKVAAKPGENMPSGSSEVPKYYYIKKTADVNTQSKSIIVNDGKSENTAWTYEFSVRLVHISKKASVPNENTSRNAAIEAALSGNTIVKSFSTKNRYYEDKLGFTKKTVNVYTGQSNVLTGTVKYSKNASYLHNLTPVAYNSEGGVCSDITCSFKNDNDELYVSVAEKTVPGKYTIAVYAGSVDSKAAPQSGTMYQASTSFTLTVSAGINDIDTYGITERVAVSNKAVSFSATPVGYGGYGYFYKAKTQKFTYEIKSVNASGKIVDPSDNVKNNISVNKNGKVTIKKGYTTGASNGDYIAVVIKAADFEGNKTEKTVKVLVSNTVLVPTEIYLTNSKGTKLNGTSFKFSDFEMAQSDVNKKSAYAKVVVLDQYGKNMNQYVTITPNKVKNTANYVWHYSNDSVAELLINKLGTISIKAVTTDGNKKSKTVKFTVSMPSYTVPVYNGKDVKVTCGGVGVTSDPKDDGVIYYDAPGNSEIRFQIGAQTFNGALYNRNLIDWQYSVTGGKLKFDGDYWIVTATAKTSELYIWFKSNPLRRWRLRFVNNGWNSPSYSTAPKIKLENGAVYTNQLSTVNNNYQQLTYSYDSVSFNKIEVTKTSTNIPTIKSIDVNTTNKTFTLNFDKGNIKAGSYKYNVVFMNGNNIACKPVTITVKVKKTPKVKITASYTLKTTDPDSSVVLKCTPSNLGFSSSAKLLNANEKGKANEFNKYFSITVAKNSEGVPIATIKLNNKYKEELKGKTITGYVKYDYYLGYNHVENVTSKVSIKIK